MNRDENPSVCATARANRDEAWIGVGLRFGAAASSSAAIADRAVRWAGPLAISALIHAFQRLFLGLGAIQTALTGQPNFVGVFMAQPTKQTHEVRAAFHPIGALIVMVMAAWVPWVALS